MGKSSTLIRRAFLNESRWILWHAKVKARVRAKVSLRDAESDQTQRQSSEVTQNGIYGQNPAWLECF